MSTLLEEVEAQQTAERSAWSTEYRALIRRADKPHKGDGARLATHMGALGLSRDDVEADVAAVKAYADVTARLADADARETAIQAERVEGAERARDEIAGAVADVLRSMSPDLAVTIALRTVQPLHRLVPTVPAAYDRLKAASETLNRGALALSAVRQQRTRDTNELHDLRRNHPRVIIDAD